MKIDCFRLERTVLVVFIVVLGVALWTTINRHQGYDIVYASYADLYSLRQSPRITGFDVQDDVLVVKVANFPDERWRVVKDGREVSEISAAHPSVQLDDGLHRYSVTGLRSNKQFQFSTTWAPGLATPLVGKSTVPIGPSARYDLDDFVLPLSGYSIDEVTRGKSIINELGVDLNAPDTTKALSLATAVYSALEPFRGSPKGYMRRLTGLRQYEEALAGRSGVHCATHSEIFAFMASVAGLPTRVVEVVGGIDDVVLGAHAFNEILVPDLNEWIYVDLQLGIAGVVDASGNYLNAAELVHRMASTSTQDLSVLKIRNGRIDRLPFSDKLNHIQVMVHPEADLVYLWAAADRFAIPERLNRVLFNPLRAYALDEAGEGAPLRLAATYSTFVLLLILVFYRARHWLRMCSCHVAAD